MKVPITNKKAAVPSIGQGSELHKLCFLFQHAHTGQHTSDIRPFQKCSLLPGPTHFHCISAL